MNKNASEAISHTLDKEYLGKSIVMKAKLDMLNIRTYRIAEQFDCKTKYIEMRAENQPVSWPTSKASNLTRHAHQQSVNFE